MLVDFGGLFRWVVAVGGGGRWWLVVVVGGEGWWWWLVVMGSGQTHLHFGSQEGPTS